MNASDTTKGTWLNPDILRWAREWRGRSIEEAAKKLNQKPERISEWETGLAVPTVKQARDLASFYCRPFVELFLKSPPKLIEPEAIADFRRHAGSSEPSEQWEVQDVHRWAEATRENYIHLYNELGYVPDAFPTDLRVSVESDVEAIAVRVRTAIGFEIQDQIKLRKTEMSALPTQLRDHLAYIGILVLRRPELAHLDVRGMCLAHKHTPTIVYTSETATAQAFTIAHELAHVLISSSGVSGFRSQQVLESGIEIWCDNFAGAFLAPIKQLEAIAGLPPKMPMPNIEKEDFAKYAAHFRISSEAMLIRLVRLGYVTEEHYWQKWYPIFRQLARDHKSGGRSKYYGSRYKNAVGNRYTNLVLEAWGNGNLTNHNAAEFLGIKNLKHLYDIRRELAA